jgi:hypothetical protein
LSSLYREKWASNYVNYIGFEDLAPVVMTSGIFWVIMMRSPCVADFFLGIAF